MKAIRDVATLATLLMATPAPAATLRVPSEYATIQAALDASAVNDTVLVACGSYQEPFLSAVQSVTLRSENGSADCVTVDLAGTPMVLSGTATVVTGLSFTGGPADTTATTILGEATTLRNCRWFANPHRALWTHGDVSIGDCSFLGNGSGVGGSSGPHGIAVHVGGIPSSTVAISGSWFQGNVGGSGGAIFRHVGSAQLTLNGCTFIGNEAGHAGGAVRLVYGDVSISACRFLGNVALLGGGVLAEHCRLQVSDCEFLDNRAAQDGGGIRVNGLLDASLALSRCTFSRNAAAGRGGAVDATGVTGVSVSDCVFRANNADRGAGLAADGSSSGVVRVDRCEFDANIADEGGALHTRTMDLQVYDSTLLRNEAAFGGAIACQITNLIVARSTLVGNRATSLGAGIYSTGTGMSSGIVLAQTIIAFSPDGEAAVRSLGSLASNAVCSNVFGNAGGDWTAGLGGLEGVNDNFSADPRFCGMQQDDVTLRSDSPCAAGNSACGAQVGSMGVGCGPVHIDPMSWGRIKAGFCGE